MDLSTIRKFEEYFKEYPFIMVDIGASPNVEVLSKFAKADIWRVSRNIE